MKILCLCTTDSMIWNFLVPHIKRLESENHIVDCACSITGSYFQELKDMGVSVYEVPFKRSPYSFQNLKAYNILSNLCKQNKYDVIFCHEPVGGAFGRIVGKLLRIKVIYMAHGFHFYKGAPLVQNILYRNIEKFLSRWTDVLITINKEDYEVSQKFFAKSSLLFNGIGVDTAKFKKFPSNYLREKFNLTSSSIKLLSVGELIPRKNHSTIIEAMSYFKDKDIHYFIAGEGPLESTLKLQVKKLNLEKQVHFLGFCRNVAELYNSCDIFIFSSVQEGLSLALMEAMSCGKPIIASRIRGNVDLISEGLGGFLIDTFNVQGYVSAINKIRVSPTIQHEMGDVNIQNVKKYDIKSVQEKIVKLFKK